MPSHGGATRACFDNDGRPGCISRPPFSIQPTGIAIVQNPSANLLCPTEHWVLLIIREWPLAHASDGFGACAEVDDPYVLNFLNSLAATNAVPNHGRLVSKA